MPALVAVLAAVVLGSAPVAAAAEPPCPGPRCRDVAVPVPEGLRVPDNRVRVLLPEGYDTGCDRYPVVYLLHGVGDRFTSWSEKTDVVAFTAGLPVIMVMPDGGHGPDAGWYSDWLDGSRQWETFHTQVLVDFVDRTFRTTGDGHRAVAGLSMGGFGAMSYAARNPGLFRAAASFSGAVDSRYVAPASGVGFTSLHDAFGTPDDRVWGNQLTDEARWKEHNPTDRAADLAGTRLFLATGTGTPGGPAGDDPGNPGAYALEAFIFQMNVSFIRALTVAGVPYEQDSYVGGYHGWPYWQRELHWALPRMLATLGGPVTCTAGGGDGSVSAGADSRVLGATDRAGDGPLPATGAGDDRWATTGLALLAAAALAAWSRRRRPASAALRP